MKFAFAGIDFLGDVFETFLQAGWEPVKLFTRPCDGIYDFNDGVLERARGLDLPVQLSRIGVQDIAALAAAGCEALVVAGYPWLVRGWSDHIRHGFNFHPSPLPVGRGPYPLFRAILDGYQSWGVTAHVLGPSFDTGAILAQETFGVASTETHESLLAKCQMSASRLAGELAQNLPGLWGAARPQSGGSYFERTTDRERRLDWSQRVGDLLRRVRAFGTIETIARVGDGDVFVACASGWTEPHLYPPGTLVHRHRRHFVVAASDGFIQITKWSPFPPDSKRR
jgi:methionyl-tRNA formyltransferase